MRLLPLAALLMASLPALSQFQMQDSHTTASLRGIHNVGHGIVWASGTEGTVLRTTDDGANWQACAVPPNAERLDFRGIQAFDSETAIVMSSGPGDLSRLYKTTDGCRTWKLLLTNPDKDGFWDAIQFSHSPGNSKSSKCFGEVVGDPINGHFALFLTVDCGDSWEKQIRESPPSLAGESLFAASNSSLSVQHQGSRIFVTGGKSGARILRFWVGFDDTTDSFSDHVAPGTSSFRVVSRGWIVESLPNSRPSESSGAFSVAENRIGRQVIVGGDYKQPDKGLAWYQERYALSHTLPHGYRSAVAYDEATKTWITVGPNGTDISRDDGLNWSALKPSPQDQPDADRNWNALSLPFVVGPKGRIGKLHPNALPSAGHEQD